MVIAQDQLKDLLVKAGLITDIQLNEITAFSKNSGVSLEDALVEKDIVSDEQLGLLIADHLKIPFVTLSKLSIPEDVFNIIPERVARKQKVIPFARDKDGVKLAMLNPNSSQIIDLIAKKTGEKVSAYLATEQDIYNTLRIYRKELQKAFDTLIAHEVGATGSLANIEAPIGKIVDAIINYAYQDRASDIHIEPEEKTSLVRFRLDGVLHDVLFLPKELHDQVITRIKILSRLRTDEHLTPQDGKMRTKLDEEELDIRVSILPIVDGEKAVLRLLASRFRQFSLIDLGMSEKDLTKVKNAYSRSFGMVLSTGPTGAGKSTSIYAILKILNIREKNITTIEDPVEYRLKGVNQIQVNTKSNLTFASGLRSILRQDPNVIFVGEIRDNETAGIAVNAALTGHLVLSTLHTNDAATALPRLIDMDVEPFLVASTVNVIIGQRLIRRICELCKTSTEVKREELVKSIPEEKVSRFLGDAPTVRLYKGEGCKICHSTGYAGRIGLYEVLVVSKAVKDLIVARNNSDKIFAKAIEEGMTTMLDDGLEKIAKGLTTLAEVLRVTKVENV